MCEQPNETDDPNRPREEIGDEELLEKKQTRDCDDVLTGRTASYVGSNEPRRIIASEISRAL